MTEKEKAELLAMDFMAEEYLREIRVLIDLYEELAYNRGRLNEFMKLTGRGEVNSDRI